MAETPRRRTRRATTTSAEPSASTTASAVVADAERARIAVVRTALLAHFDAHKRALPWRATRDPYAIWVSEVMLQQTRVETVVPYYARFLERFPTPRALADAPLERVLAAWSGLGYYRRARMLHAGARAVVDAHAGALPADPTALRALPGIGAYTAGAIASIAFGLREALVDGNVERVITRLFALGGDPRAGATKGRIWTLARAFADSVRPGDVNQALMELGATVCTPVAPRCLVCPARDHCAARAAGEPERYPEKRARVKARAESWSALVVSGTDGQGAPAVWLAESEIGRWTGMLLPPLAPTGDPAAARAHFAALGVSASEPAGRVTHVLTHAAMDVTVYRATVAASLTRGRWVARAALASRDAVAVPKITRAIVAAADA